MPARKKQNAAEHPLAGLDPSQPPPTVEAFLQNIASAPGCRVTNAEYSFVRHMRAARAAGVGFGFMRQLIALEWRNEMSARLAAHAKDPTAPLPAEPEPPALTRAEIVIALDELADHARRAGLFTIAPELTTLAAELADPRR